MSTSNPEDNFIIVIRSSGERTFEICRKLLEQQASPEQVTFVKLTPFKAALEECFRIGIHSEKKWLITVDADMLVLPDAIDTLVGHAEEMPENFIQLQGKIKDKLTDNVRKGGPRIYRVSLLHKLLELSLAAEDHIRPESYVITSAGELGYPSRYISFVTCFHDYEQYYRDLYRKAFVHAHKHHEYAGKLIQQGIEKREFDTDYRVILRAVMDGLEHKGTVSIDKVMFQERAALALRELEIDEKKPIDASSNPSLFINSIQKFESIDNNSTIHFSDQPEEQKSISDNYMRILKRDGIIRGSLHGIGILLVKIGRKFQIHGDNK